MQQQRQLQVEEVVQVQKAKAEAAKQTSKVTVFLGQFGRGPQAIEVDQGTTLKDFIKAQGVEKLEIRVNQEVKNGRYELQDQDLVVAVPDAIVGGVK